MQHVRNQVVFADRRKPPAPFPPNVWFDSGKVFDLVPATETVGHDHRIGLLFTNTNGERISPTFLANNAPSRKPKDPAIPQQPEESLSPLLRGAKTVFMPAVPYSAF